MKQDLIIALAAIILQEFGDPDADVQLEIPQDLSHGDYSTNIALVLSKKLGRQPREIAEVIVEKLKSSPEFFKLSGVEVAGPGFINFTIPEEELLANLNSINTAMRDFGKNEKLLDQQVMVEFGDPNPFKEFHIGHLYTMTIGEALARLSESQGATVWRVCYQGDVGLHVAKALYGMQYQIQHEQASMSTLEEESIEDRAKFLGKAYAFGAKAYEEDPEAKEKIHEINKKVYDRSDPEITNLYDIGRAWSLEYFELIYDRLGTDFNNFYFESEVGPIGLKFIEDHMDLFEKDDGAVIFPGKKYGLHNRVFINSLGLPTYEAKELGLAPTKYKDFAYDTSVIVTGNEVNEYFKVLLKALSLINPELAEKTKHIGHGMVRLPEGKMSSRTGNVITCEWLLNEAYGKIKAAYPKMNDDTAEMVAVGAVKYALLKSSIGGDIAFSFDESISLSGNSGPYIQYTYARTQSILRHELAPTDDVVDSDGIIDNEQLILRVLTQFPEVVEEAAAKFAPNVVATYLFELAQLFNNFYQQHKIIGSDREDFRISLTRGVGQVLENGLHLLGIQAPEKM